MKPLVVPANGDYLLDTSSLLRRVDPQHPQHQVARDVLKGLSRAGVALWITPQVMIEFRAVATRPVENRGLGMTLKRTQAEAAIIESRYKLAVDTPDIFSEWRRLVETHKVSGLQVHDARLAAVMAVYSIKNILTFNERDFRRYPHVIAVNPQQLIAALA